MRSHRRNPLWLPLGLSLLTLGAGASHFYFPLDQGNRWHVVGEGRFVTLDHSGAQVGGFTAREDYARTIDGTEDLFGRTYTLMREDLTETVDGGAPDGFTTWIRYRQDGSGLYEADVDLATPPGGEPPAAVATQAGRSSAGDRMVRHVPENRRAAYRAAWDRLQTRIDAIHAAARRLGTRPARALAENELTRLRYPLHRGQSWEVRADPRFTSEVEATESVALPAGRFASQRIRIDSELFGPQDRVHLWMSRSGQLALEYHVEGDATDENGNVVGRMTADYREELQDLSLAAR